MVISKTGCGKSYVIQAIGNATRRRLIPVRYTRLADLLRRRGLSSGTRTAYLRYRLLLINGAKPGDRRYRERLLLTIEEVFPGAAWQRCIVRLERNVCAPARNRRERALLGSMMRTMFEEADENWAARRWFAEESISEAYEDRSRWKSGRAASFDGAAAEHAARIIALVMADGGRSEKGGVGDGVEWQ